MNSSTSATQFINCRQCISGELVSKALTVDGNGYIIPNAPLPEDARVVDLNNAVVAPGFIELQINGALGFHFAHFEDGDTYQAGIEKLARYLPSTGVTGFYPTVPTVSSDVFQKVLPFLRPGTGGKDLTTKAAAATVLGAHVEGPYLAPEKKGAHDAAHMHHPSAASPEVIYGARNVQESIKIVTLAPELPGALALTQKLRDEYGTRVSMGHSAATYAQGRRGIEAGASLLTHTFNAMNPLHHREPGLPGLIATRTRDGDGGAPYFSLIADAIHLHAGIVALAYRASPSRCILITDSIELSGLPDGIHPGHAQIPFNQLKAGNKVTIENTDTLVGTCIGLDECVRNLMSWAELSIQDAVRCVTDHVADAMGLQDRGRLDVGMRADFVVLGEDCTVKETWILGQKAFG
ncbi:N-acetylglucosamine-6-phosphate deacetylase [Phlyctema vagabunda]|uniref:N-acetylglucosamine-6-phosphate deacetylase n=1 Tax=Phlyctema vagabunda TaxID=108571 RepID=A0ABR4PV80_9HELO